MRVGVGAVESLYVCICVGVFWSFANFSVPVSAIFGYLACLLFLPAYGMLVWAGKLLPIDRFIYESIVGFACIFFMHFFFEEGKSNEMSALFLASYIACKPLRLSLALVIGRMKKEMHYE